jgi:hypothetical protein
VDANYLNYKFASTDLTLGLRRPRFYLSSQFDRNYSSAGFLKLFQQVRKKKS